ncbi:hypothetical protein [Variovorax boronicumulans]
MAAFAPLAPAGPAVARSQTFAMAGCAAFQTVRSLLFMCVVVDSIGRGWD